MSAQTRRHRVAAAIRRGDPTWAREFEAILKAYEQAGGNPNFLRSPRIASLVVSGNQDRLSSRLP